MDVIASLAIVSRTRCSVLHAAPQSRDRTKHRVLLRPRLSSAPRREVRRAAQHPGHESSREDPSMQIIDPRETAPEQWRPGAETRMRVSAENGATQLCIFEQWIAPGAGAPTHRHPIEEVLTVIAGEAEMWLDD